MCIRDRKEAARSSHELQLLGINNQLLVINGLLLQLDEADSVSKQIYEMCIRDSLYPDWLQFADAAM